MRTKTLLLTAALSAAGIATSMAQNVYSVNMVGYINKTMPKGLSMIANQLNASPNNKVTTLFGTPALVDLGPGVPGAITINKFNGINYDLRVLPASTWCSTPAVVHSSTTLLVLR
jgi:hypothetical protein